MSEISDKRVAQEIQSLWENPFAEKDSQYKQVIKDMDSKLKRIESRRNIDTLPEPQPELHNQVRKGRALLNRVKLFREHIRAGKKQEETRDQVQKSSREKPVEVTSMDRKDQRKIILRKTNVI